MKKYGEKNWDMECLRLPVEIRMVYAPVQFGEHVRYAEALCVVPTVLALDDALFAVVMEEL